MEDEAADEQESRKMLQGAVDHDKEAEFYPKFNGLK